MDELAIGPALDRGSAAADLARAVAFLHAFARRRAPVVRPVPGGFAVLDDRYPGSYDDNKLIIREAPGEDLERAAELLMAAADEALATRGHRLVCVDDDRLGTSCAPAFTAAGWTHETNLVMTFHCPTPTTPPPTAPQAASQAASQAMSPVGPPPVEVLGLEEVVAVLRRDWRESLPEASDETIDALARRAEARLPGAATVGFRGVRAPGGEIATRADLYVHGGVAQIESVFTAEPHRGQGYARILMNALLAEVAEAELIFLLADADDWPRHFYTSLGFEIVGRTHAFLRT
ncbi:GNAT family N-acetyltransferase [Nonomuraea sp. NPDC048892]|uniref:GNAT family N-acetyltransferase n=1 Tax=Nonomuraea sp. NPDC048892 TaxID=3154624 RepID=UPI0033FF6D87